MKQTYSVPLTEEVYKDNPDYTSCFLPQIHRQAEIADNASIQCQIDLYGEDIGKRFGNNNSHSGNFTALTAPECLPERLALVSYTIEYAFLHDDATDNANAPAALLNENKMLLQALNPHGNDLKYAGLSDLGRRKAEVRAKIAAELLRMDPVFGKWFLGYWKKFTESIQDIRSFEFPTLNAYLAFRVVDAGAIWTLSLIRWGTDNYLTPQEERTAGPITYLGYAALALTNDLFSYGKERKAYVESNGEIPLVNAVHIVMQERSLDEETAKAAVVDEIRIHEERFQKQREEYKAKSDASPAITKWLTILEYSISGNFVWSLKTPRYWKDVGNPYQEQYQKLGHDPDAFKLLKPLAVHPIPDGTITMNIDQETALSTLDSKEADSIYSGPLDLLRDSLLFEPYGYMMSLPSKNVRQILIGALNVWYRVPDQSLFMIQGVANYLHNASLILDDIQDGSPLRRGKPAAHKIFGIGQSINSAGFLINEALRLVQSLSKTAVAIYSEELRNLHIGQGYDLSWTYHTHVPTEEEYLGMVDGKTGGLFRLISRLMRAEATINQDLEINKFMTGFGRYFQIRDDYQNLQSADYATNKGVCEDLDEGKLSYPLISALRSSGRSDTILLSILQSRCTEGSLSPEMKEYALQKITTCGGLTKTEVLLKKLHAELLQQLCGLEIQAGGMENWSLRLIVAQLDIGDNRNDFRVEGPRSSGQKSFWHWNQEQAWASA